MKLPQLLYCIQILRIPITIAARKFPIRPMRPSTNVLKCPLDRSRHRRPGSPLPTLESRIAVEEEERQSGSFVGRAGSRLGFFLP